MNNNLVSKEVIASVLFGVPIFRLCDRYSLLSTCLNFEHAIAKLHGQSESTFISNFRSIVALLYIICMHRYAMKGLINDVFHISNR